MRSNIRAITATAMTVALALAALGNVGASATQASDGCTAGYWKQQRHLDSWVGYDPSDETEIIFGVATSFTGPLYLLDALQLRGGGEAALSRLAVASLLSAASPHVDYLYTEADVIAIVQDAYASGEFEGAKDLLANAGEGGCPLA